MHIYIYIYIYVYIYYSSILVILKKLQILKRYDYIETINKLEHTLHISGLPPVMKFIPLSYISVIQQRMSKNLIMFELPSKTPVFSFLAQQILGHS